MTVAELIAALQKMPPDLVVVTAGEFTSTISEARAVAVETIGEIVGDDYTDVQSFPPGAYVALIS